ncbi:MAG: adhesin, partial [Actinobacteria bacterium]|nr:adhesin [Actinomycetota bacterium]
MSCNGGADGRIDVSVFGGVSPYTYAWSNGASSDDLSNVVAGVYTLIITDQNSCTLLLTDTVSEPQPILASAVAVPNSCNGGSNGSVDLTVSGGIAPYNYLWNNFSTSQDINGLPAGSYSVIVTDSRSCLVTTTAVVSQPAAILIAANLTPVNCNG